MSGARQVGPFTLPTAPALPAPAASRAAQVAVVGGVPFIFDGTSWSRLGGGAVSFLTGTLNLDVGPVPQPEHTLTVNLPGATTGSSVFATLAPTAPGKDPDEVGMDVVDVWAFVPADGSLTVRLTGLTGPIADGFTVTYLLAKG